MKKLLKLLFVPTLLVGFMVSCSTDDDHDYGYGKNHELSAQFKATLPGVSTRVTDSNWDKEDAIGIYALKVAMPLEEENVVKGNAKYTTVSETGSGDFSSAAPEDVILFDKDGSQLDFIAYYPYTPTVTDYSLPINTEDQSNLSKIDFLYSNNATEHSKDEPEVILQFKHQLAQIVLEITGDADLSDLSALKLAVDGFVPTGTMSLKDGAVALEGTTAKTLNLTATKTDNGAIVRAIVLPGQDMANTSFVFELGSIKFKAWTPGTLALESGKRVTYTIKLTSDGSVQASLEGNIADWIEESGGDVTIDPEEGGETGDITIPDADKALDFGATADTKVINVTAPATVTWEATTNDSWITLDNPTATGSGVFTLKVAENPTTTARTGKVTIAPKASTRADVAATPVEIIVKQEGKSVTPDPDQNLLFPGSDFEDWDAFLGVLNNFGLSTNGGYASQSADGGREGSSALQLKGKSTKNDYTFTATVPSGFSAAGIENIVFYVKGTSAKSLSMNVYVGTGTLMGTDYKCYNLKDCSGPVTLEPTASNDYIGVIDTKGEWVKVTLDVSSLTINSGAGQNLFAMKVGKDVVYDLLVDDITFE